MKEGSALFVTNKNKQCILVEYPKTEIWRVKYRVERVLVFHLDIIFRKIINNKNNIMIKMLGKCYS